MGLAAARRPGVVLLVWVFPTEESPKPHARVVGTVLETDIQTVAQTGQRFVHTCVRTVGFEIHVCLPASEGVLPAVGSILHGTVYLVGYLSRIVEAAKVDQRG